MSSGTGGTDTAEDGTFTSQVEGALMPTYTPTADDVGKYLKARAVYADGPFEIDEEAASDPIRVTVTPAASMDATLSALSLMAGDDMVTLTPAFASDTMDYTAMVDNDVMSVNVMATATDADDATVTGTGMMSLDVGANTINVMVTAEDGTTMMTYTVTVTRAEMTAVTRAEVIALIDAYLAGGANAPTRAAVIALIDRYLSQ